MTLFYDAIAYISGSSLAPRLRGTIKFKAQDGGTWIYIDISGLPSPQISSFGFHIHEGSDCGDNVGETPFQAAGEHWLPEGRLPGSHIRDFPVLIQSNGFLKFAHFTDRFVPEDIIGKTVIVHQSPDDCKTCLPGERSSRIGCGVIM